MRIVFDTNVYVQMMNARGFVDKLMREIAARPDLELFTSIDILVELRRTLTKKLRLSPDRVAAILGQVYRIAEQVEPRESISGVLKDEDDHIILACAVECRADCIVTSDREMLKLKTFRGIAIVHPSTMKFTGVK